MYTGTLQQTSNAEDWIETFQCVDDENNAVLDLTGVTISVAVERLPNSGLVLSGSLSDGHVFVMGVATEGVFRVRFSDNEMSALAAGEYLIGMVITFVDGITEQIILGQLPVIDGVVRP